MDSMHIAYDSQILSLHVKILVNIYVNIRVNICLTFLGTRFIAKHIYPSDSMPLASWRTNGRKSLSNKNH